MSFVLYTDCDANLPGALLNAGRIRVLPGSYTFDGQTAVCSGDIDHFDARDYYDKLRAGHKVTTSLLNTQLFLDALRPVLEAGQDAMYVGLSGGISGTIAAARIAARELEEEFPGRTVAIVDAMGAGMGVGLLTLRAAELRDGGMDIRQAAETLERERMNLCEYFIVDDLMFLKGTGRVSPATAALGTVLNIKPILRGDEQGHITSNAKCRGRKKAIETIARIYGEKVRNAGEQMVAISHGDCLEDARRLAELVEQTAKPRELLIVPHEPFTGAHVGPGMLALFFFGEGR